MVTPGTKNRTRRKRIIFYGVAVIIATAILFFATGTVDELLYAEFNVQGRVVDEGGNPLPGVDVLLLINEWHATDKKEQESIFERQGLMRSTEQFPANFGLSDKHGHYTAWAASKYGRRSLPLPRFLRDNKHPFKKAWLVFKRAGYKTGLVEIDSSQWKPNRINSDRPLIQLTDVKMELHMPSLTPPYDLSFPVRYNMVEDAVEVDCSMTEGLEMLLAENHRWALALDPKPAFLEIRVVMSAPDTYEYKLALVERCGRSVKEKMLDLGFSSFDIRITPVLPEREKLENKIVVSFNPITY